MTRPAMRERPPAVAGMFYPSDPAQLARTVDDAVAAAASSRLTGPATGPATAPKALIVPHAGYVYSGPIAGSGYSLLVGAARRVRRVVLAGPAHRVPVRSMAVPSSDVFRTPLGAVPVDADARDVAARLPGVVVDDRPHAPEHSLEVQLPFLQRVLGPALGRHDEPRWTALPVVVGDATDDEVASLFDALWGGPETLLVVSSDLSHYLDAPAARAADARTVAAITAGQFERLGPRDACGVHPVRGLLLSCRRRGLRPRAIDVRCSADTAGEPDRVVGYAALAVDEPTGVDGPTGDDEVADPRDRRVTDPAPVDAAGLSAADRRVLLDTARQALTSLHTTRGSSVDLSDVSQRLRAPGASFVTLRTPDGALRGCIGSMDATEPLVVDVAANARRAASRDPRFAPVAPHEVDRLDVHVAVLTPLQPLAVDDLDQLRSALRPGIDGVLVEAGRHRGTFLPAVWSELPAVDDFLRHLWIKAGLTPGAWPPGMRIWRYQAVDVS